MAQSSLFYTHNAMNTSKQNNNDIWDVYIGSHIVDSNMNWSAAQNQALPLKTPIHTITACNPFENILTNDENNLRNHSLQEYIETLNLEFKPVIGRSSNGDWQENSFAIYGFTRSQACQLAQTFGQRAIFELTKKELLVIDANSFQLKRRRPR